VEGAQGKVQLRKALVSPEVRLYPGIAGRWLLSVDEGMPSPRVYRID
jgi:hypothetical protein